MWVRIFVFLVLSLAVLISGCTGGASQKNEPVVVSAAASLGDALKELQSEFEASEPGSKLQLNFGSSGALQQQIEQGAPVDLFIPAAREPMEALVRKGLVEAAAVQTLATNRVVLIRSRSGAAPFTGWSDLGSPRVTRIAIGNPAYVPAGQYGEAVLRHLGLWESVAGRLILGEDARQVLRYVETGEAEAGIVYRTDAARSAQVTIAAEAPPGSHPQVVYPMAVVRQARHAARAEAFAKYLLSARGRAVLKKYGFEVGE